MVELTGKLDVAMGLVGVREDFPYPPPVVELTGKLDVAMGLVGVREDFS